MNRQTIIVVVIVSAVTGVLAAFGAVNAFRAEASGGAPGSTAALQDRVKSLEARLESLEGGKVDKAAFDNGLTSISERMSALEKASRAAPGTAEGQPPAASPLAGLGLGGNAGSSEDTMRAVGEMMKVQLKQGRDRYVNDLLNPTEASQARQQREVRRWAGMAAGNLGLDEAQRTAVEQVLAEVDQSRREKLRQIFASKPADQVTWSGDLKSVIDESFIEEDQRISQVLPPDKAEQYRQNAETIRGFITTMASAAFPDPK